MFLLRAIEALRPGKFRPRLQAWPKERDDYPIGVRYYERRRRAKYRSALGRVATGHDRPVERRACDSVP